MPRFAANISFLFTELPFLERFAAAADAGFEGVEFLFPYEWEVDDVATAARDAGLTVVLFNAAPGDWQAGERGIGALVGRENAFHGDIYRAAAYARALGCRRLHILAGLVPDGEPRAPYVQTFVENLSFAASHLAGFGIEALIEPINPVDMPGYLLANAEDALEVMELVKDQNLFLQLDLYHGAVMCAAGGVNNESLIRKHFERIHHVQVAGWPGRHEPDTGEASHEPAFRLLDELGYEGWVGCEYHPRGETVAGLGWLRDRA